MKLFSIIKPYKAMILDESILSNEFTIGFELEGIVDNEEYPRSGLPSYHSNSQPYGGAKKLLDKLNEMLGMGEGHIESDSSVQPVGRTTDPSGHEYSDSTSGESWGFEYVTPKIPFTPQNIAKIDKFLKGLKDIGVKTNRKCGFHTHISYPDMGKKDVLWALFSIANNENLYNEIKELDEGDYKIAFSSDFANSRLFDTLKDLGDVLRNRGNSSVTIDNEKYRMMRIHPQGTIEWRGPRNFINDGSNGKVITDYLKKLHKVIMAIGDIVTRKSFNGFDKETVLKHINYEGHVEFNSDYEKKLKAKGKGLINRVKDKQETLAKMPEKILKTLFSNSENASNVLYSVRDWFKDNVNEVSTKNLEKLFKYIAGSEAGMNEICRFFTSVFSEYDSISENLSEIILKEFVDKNKLGYLDSSLLNKFRVTDQKLIMDTFKFYSKNNIGHVIQFLQRNQNYVPLKIYMDISKIQPYMLKKFSRIPVKVQRALTRKVPYSIQYIINPDPSVVNALKQKYGDEIDDYILDEV